MTVQELIEKLATLAENVPLGTPVLVTMPNDEPITLGGNVSEITEVRVPDYYAEPLYRVEMAKSAEGEDVLMIVAGDADA